MLKEISEQISTPEMKKMKIFLIFSLLKLIPGKTKGNSNKESLRSILCNPMLISPPCKRLIINSKYKIIKEKNIAFSIELRCFRL
jgi:hypothetical protein